MSPSIRIYTSFYHTYILPDRDQAKYFFLEGATEEDIDNALKRFVEHGKEFDRSVYDSLLAEADIKDPFKPHSGNLVFHESEEFGPEIKNM